MEDGIILLTLIIDLIIAVMALWQNISTLKKTAIRDAEQEQAIGEIQTALNKLAKFNPKKWYNQ